MERALFRASQAGHPTSRHSPFRTAVGMERPDRCAVPGSGRAPPRAHAGAPGSRIRGEHGAAIMGGLTGEGLGAPAEGVPPRASVRCRNTGSADARCERRGAGSRQPIRQWPVTTSARRAPPARPLGRRACAPARVARSGGMRMKPAKSRWRTKHPMNALTCSVTVRLYRMRLSCTRFFT